MDGQAAVYPSLAGRQVFLTGGATGIGAAMVEAFAGQGAAVDFVDLDAAAGAALAARLPGVRFHAGDVTDTAGLQAAIEAVIAREGRLDVLVNNAANDRRHAIETVSPELWERVLAVNVGHAFFAIQAAMPVMVAAGRGAILNFGSIAWRVKIGAMPAYTTAKAAMHGLTRSLTQVLGRSGVRINTIAPGWVLTERQRADYLTPEAAARLAEVQALPGEIAPAAVAALALFLASDDAAMITGQEITIDGGWT
ncbi:MAG: SDR family oxidoreductase [Rhodobacteraceae bacterium]|jgi:NAD(P)-dependent dehydrogenase (short-subunit alcohol dehydrogenase family)|nr:SDR family oxidoreductase [Paracoccaceae bacterium]